MSMGMSIVSLRFVHHVHKLIRPTYIGWLEELMVDGDRVYDVSKATTDFWPPSLNDCSNGELL
jgi:hypothetical protein